MDDSRTIYCGNLAKDVTEELLYELFLQAGPVDRVNIPKDKQGNKRNFGFVVFKHDISVAYAVQLMSGEKLFGQVLRLQARANNSEAAPEMSNNPGAGLHKTMSCPSGFSPNHRNNYDQGNNWHGSRSSNGERMDYRNQHSQHNNYPSQFSGFNGPVFVNNQMQPQFCPVELPLALTSGSNFSFQNSNLYQQNWPVRGNRWMQN